MRAFLFLLTLSLVTWPLAANPRALDTGTPLVIHLEADAESPVLASFSPAGENWSLRESLAPNEEAQAEGWRAVQFVHPVSAWVRNTNLTKDLALRPDTPVFIARETTVANMLVVLEDPAEAEVLETEKGWAKVELTTSLVGFARREEWLPAPATPAPEAEVAADEDLFASAETIEITSATTPPPSPPAQAQPRRATLQTADGQSISGTMRFYEGFLGQNRGSWGRSPEYAYSLTNERGRRLADLDTSNLLLTTNLRKQIGRKIAVQGIMREEDDRRIPVIVLESLHLP